MAETQEKSIGLTEVYRILAFWFQQVRNQSVIS